MSGIGPSPSSVICDGQRRHGLTGAQRQPRFRAKVAETGLTSVTLLVPAGAAVDLQLVAQVLREWKHPVPGPLRDPLSGKLVSAKTALRHPALAVKA